MKLYDYTTLGCKNCGTHRYEEKRSGYCQRCAYKALKIGSLRKATWKPRGRYRRFDNHDRFWEIWKTEQELHDLRILEAPLLAEHIDPLAIEGLLFSIVNASRARPESWTNLGNCFFNAIPPDKNQDFYCFLYQTLLEVVETVPVRRYRTMSRTLWWWHSHRSLPDFEEFKEWKRQTHGELPRDQQTGHSKPHMRRKTQYSPST